MPRISNLFDSCSFCCCGGSEKRPAAPGASSFGPFTHPPTEDLRNPAAHLKPAPVFISDEDFFLFLPVRFCFASPQCTCRTAPMGNHGSNLDDILAEDMHHWYNKFMRESPSGLITLFELKAILALKGLDENANSYVDQVFFTFDMDGDGYIDFVEYIAAISLMLKGEINQKLKWYFKLFDQDGNGKIDKEELETIFSAIQDITRNRDIDPEEIVSIIFERIDVKGEGEMTLEEFIEGAKDHEDIMDMLKNLMDLTPVLMIIVQGRV
ncbi:guanylate cyclase activator 1d isoform X1 [Mastacembelus armatus]|uniref:Guanylate cyclase activator 1d n=2 Tax=Mastacembelus armatus TaxID=205130 RepID=A0A3Q3NJT8_9TELE|nr:guanylyl cyclase-activating protein 1-like isoform X1 [Mastacembelus armatus]